MKSPLLQRSPQFPRQARSERGVTMILIALALVAIMAMAALSIDVVTLYLANAETQRAADSAALAGARILSITGMTGDPGNSTGNWTTACTLATQVAQAVAEQNAVGGVALTNAQVTVNFSAGGLTFPDCSTMPAAFGVNPIVNVNVQRPNLPTFFARIWGSRGATVSGSASAEAFNSSNSDTATNGGPTGTVTPVQPRCVKPWIVPNVDPGNPIAPYQFVGGANGAIQRGGISLGGTGAGVIGETLNLIADCNALGGPTCTLSNNPPTKSVAGPTPNLQYVPGAVPVSFTAAPSCADVTPYQEAIAGCDQTTVYQCGVPSATASTPNRLDLNENPSGFVGDTSVAAQCLIHQSTGGQDSLNTAAYPFQINPGAGNPLGLAASNIITSSNSIVSLPIYDGTTIPAGLTPDVTIVGFLQVFINLVNSDGSLNVTVLNVNGCGDGTNPVGTAVSGSSPVPVRLIQKYP
jgi:Flp pilus assembly protein TadG